MQPDALGITLLALLALFGGFAWLVCHVDGLTPFGPKNTRQIAGSADAYCRGGCRTADGRCPLTGTAVRAAHCPLWGFVDADMPTVLHGSPFETVGEAA